ncbi:hypothetical protein CLU79DRAFT_831132 [Phycomyces nitens]|nr:hypothetical protein CLU79DRAFT_831132 [Phycomyces nitens]
MSLTANNLMRAPGVESRSFWFAYEVLVMETIHDQEQRYGLARAALDLIKQRKTEPLVEPEISGLFKTVNAQIKKPSDFLSIYRWAQHILVLPHNHPLLPLYLQIFFCLYYSSVTVNDKTLLYGTYFFSKKQELLHRVRDRTAYLQTYHSQQPSGEKGELGVSAIVSTNSNISISSCCSSNQSSGNNHEALRQIYYSMWLWLGNPDLLRPDFDLSTLPPHYSISRLKQCRQSSTFDAWEVHQPWNSKTSLWFDLVNKKQLQDAFIQFPWEGSEKFCKRPAGSIETQATVADEGSVYSNNEIFRVISKPIPTTIQPPPATQFKKPITVLPGEQLVNMDPKDFLGPTFETFQHHAVLFQERIKNQEDLDEAYVEQLGLLYTNTPITETLTIPCVQMPQGICKKPAQLTLSATFVETNTEVRQQIEQNRKEANQLIFDSVDTTVCHEALVGLKNISSIAKYYTEIRTKQQTKEDAKCLQLSWSCITYALKCFEDSVEMYPPFRLFLRQMAKSLADLINTQQLSAERLLQLMMAKETRVVILYPAFRPNIDPKNMVSMHQRVSDTNIFGPRSQLYLLSAFDMSNWGATTFATKQDRDSFYTNSFGSLKYWMEFQSNQVDLPTIASIRIQQYKLSLSLMTTILAKQPQAMEHVTVLRYALNLLSETNDTKEADGFSGAMIDSLTESLGGRSRKVLDILNTKPDEMPFRLAMLSTPEEVSSLVDYLGSYISTISNQKGENGDLFGVFGYASPALCRLMVNALCDERIMDQNTNIVIPAPSFWTRTTECFHGWWKSSDDCAMICGESDHSYTKREYLPFFAEAYGHLIKRMLILVPLDDKAKLLGVLFDYYHEEIITHHSELWLDRFNGALVKLPWGSLEMSEGQLDKIKSTWSLLKSDNSTKRIVYLGFAFVILRLWLKKYAQKKDDYINRSWLKSYFQVFFIFLQDSVELWPVEKERLEALQILHNVMIDNQNIDVLAPKDIEETLVIPTDKINGLLGKWPEEKDTSTTALCVRWIREITRFDEKETPMRMKKVFSDFIMKLLSESSKDQLPSKDVQEYWVNQIWANINYHTEDDTREPFDAQLKDLLKSMLDTLDQDQFEAGWNVLVANASQGQPKTVLALFSALLSIKLSPKSTYFMERCLESYLDNSANKKIPQEYWDKLSLVITNSTVNTTLLLKYCMDKSFLLTIRAYCEAMIQQNQNAQTKQAEFAEEIAAIVSITKIQTSDQTQAKKMTYLIQQFAQVFCKNKANTLKEARLVAGLISLSRTTARWANPNLPLSNATPNGINDPKPLPACPAWQHFSLLLDSFLAIRLEEAGMGISTLPSSRVSLEDRIKRLETIRIKKNVAFDEALSDGISIIKDGSQWSLWKLDKVVSKFSEILFI